MSCPILPAALRRARHHFNTETKSSLLVWIQGANTNKFSGNFLALLIFNRDHQRIFPIKVISWVPKTSLDMQRRMPFRHGCRSALGVSHMVTACWAYRRAFENAFLAMGALTQGSGSARARRAHAPEPCSVLPFLPDFGASSFQPNTA
jgi:hypothetical protein